MSEIMLSKISYVMLWVSCVSDTDSIYFLRQLVFWHTNRNVLTIQNSNGAYTQTVSHYENSVYHWTYLSLPVQATVLKTTPSISLFFYKNRLFSIMDLSLPWNIEKTHLNANAYKPQDEKLWHLDSTVEWILALLHTNELKVRDKEHLLGISSGCQAGPKRRRYPLRLVPFWTPPVRQARGQWWCSVTRMWYLRNYMCCE